MGDRDSGLVGTYIVCGCRDSGLVGDLYCVWVTGTRVS